MSWSSAMDDALEPIFGLVLVMFLGLLVLTFGLLAFILWLIISGLISYVRYQSYHAQAALDGNATLAELGWQFEADDVFSVAFGTEDLSPRRMSQFDWFEGVVLGRGDDDYEE